jgi:hypothetical protein
MSFAFRLIQLCFIGRIAFFFGFSWQSNSTCGAKAFYKNVWWLGKKHWNVYNVFYFCSCLFSSSISFEGRKKIKEKKGQPEPTSKSHGHLHRSRLCHCVWLDPLLKSVTSLSWSRSSYLNRWLNEINKSALLENWNKCLKTLSKVLLRK